MAAVSSGPKRATAPGRTKDSLASKNCLSKDSAAHPPLASAAKQWPERMRPAIDQHLFGLTCKANNYQANLWPFRGRSGERVEREGW